MEATEVADDLLTDGWAAPAAVGPDPRDFERAVSLTIAQANVIHERDETITDLRRQLAAAVGVRDEMLHAAHRYETTSIRLSKDNRGLRERLDAVTRANHARPRRRLGWAR